MRKSLFLSLTLGGLLFGVFSFHSCQKETKETFVSKQKEKKPPVQTKECRQPLFYNPQVGVACIQGYGCDQMPRIPQRSQNRIQWKLKNCTNGLYVGIAIYAVYKKTGTSGGYPSYTKITGFQCDNSDMWYAHPLLTNNSDFVILVTKNPTPALPTTLIEEYNSINNSYAYYDTSYGNVVSASDFWRFSTGSTAGSVNCITIIQHK
ncbi:hypothetical protein D3C71_1013370 [compost metagenome]